MMRYLYILVAYLALVPFFPTLMGWLGLIVVAAWLFNVFKSIFAPPNIEPEIGESTEPECDSNLRMAPPPETQPDSLFDMPDQIETDEEFLVRMRTMNR